MSDQPQDSKLIIDEDWKSQVQREKAELEKKQAAQPAAGEQPTSPAESEQPQPGTGSPAGSLLPSASLPMLIASLGTQAMAALGQIPGDDGKPLPVNFDFAKHFIDLIAVIEEKTKGNLNPEEEHYLRETLHQLRIAFVEVRTRATKATND